jgi:hypothetical protein
VRLNRGPQLDEGTFFIYCGGALVARAASTGIYEGGPSPIEAEYWVIKRDAIIGAGPVTWTFQQEYDEFDDIPGGIDAWIAMQCTLLGGRGQVYVFDHVISKRECVR